MNTVDVKYKSESAVACWVKKYVTTVVISVMFILPALWQGTLISRLFAPKWQLALAYHVLPFDWWIRVQVFG